jgi:hypothetical protein
MRMAGFVARHAAGLAASFGGGWAWHRLAACAAAFVALAQPLHAADDDVCGEPKASPQALYQRLAKDSRIREMHRNELYVGLENGQDGTLWTFTLEKHPAHPAAVCRRVVDRRGRLDIPTTVVCEGAKAACAELKADFEALNAQIIDDLYKQQGKGPPKPPETGK